MNIISLDTASKTGWATLINGRITSGMQDFTKTRGESNGMLFLKFSKWLSDLNKLVNAKVDVVSFEQAHLRGGAAANICVGLTTRVEEFAERIGAECMPVQTTTLKLFITGKGNADKKLIQAWFEKRTGRPPISDDESDAYAILEYTRNKVDLSYTRK